MKIFLLLMITLNLNLLPKQIQLKNLIENSNYGWIGYGGARGGAKSFAIDDIAILMGFKYNVYSLIFRRFYNELLDNHINPIFERFPFLRNSYNSSDKILYNPKTKQPIIRFGYAEYEADINKFQGPSYPLIFVDEATQSTQFMIEFLKTSNRDPQGKLPSKAKIVLTGNPGGVSHGFYQRIFIDKTYLGNEKAEDYFFIQSHVWDNVYWGIKELTNQGHNIKDYYKSWTEQQRIDFTMKYSDYAQNLAGLPEQLKLAYLWGRWDTFAGMFFKGFDANKEVIEPFPIPLEWDLVGSLDPGFSSPLSFGLQAKDFKGNVYRIGTYYNIAGIPDHAIAVKKWLTAPESPIYKYTKGRIPKTIVAGRDAFAKVDKSAIVSNEETIFKFFDEQGLTLVKGNDGPGSRIPNWWAWKSIIPNRFFIFKDLNNPLLQQMTTVEADGKVVEDIKGRGNDPEVEDHALDECKLGIFALSTQKEPIPDNIPRWLTELNKPKQKNFMEL